MKTIPVYLIVAGFLTPVLSLAQPERRTEGLSPREDDGKRGSQRPHMDFWKFVDKDHDGFLSKGEFDMVPRIQNLPEEKRLGLFNRLDKDQDGKLGREELGRIGKSHEGQGPPEQKFWELDMDKSGGISLDEFKAGKVFKKLPPERQSEVFQRLDTNHDGMITPQDKPEPPFKREGGDPRQKRPDGGKPDGNRMDPRQIIRQLDKDNDGALSFDEFRVGQAVKALSEDEQEDRFEEMDKNHDLKLTAEDFTPPASHGDGKRPDGPSPAKE